MTISDFAHSKMGLVVILIAVALAIYAASGYFMEDASDNDGSSGSSGSGNNDLLGQDPSTYAPLSTGGNNDSGLNDLVYKEYGKIVADKLGQHLQLVGDLTLGGHSRKVVDGIRPCETLCANKDSLTTLEAGALESCPC